MCALRLILGELDQVTAGEVAAELERRGFDVVGIADSVAALGALADAVPFDLALVAAQLHDGYSFAHVRSLLALGRPVGFVTAFRREELPDDLQGLPLLSKPVAAAQVADFAESVLAQQGDAMPAGSSRTVPPEYQQDRRP